MTEEDPNPFGCEILDELALTEAISLYGKPNTILADLDEIDKLLES